MTLAQVQSVSLALAAVLGSVYCLCALLALHVAHRDNQNWPPPPERRTELPLVYRQHFDWRDRFLSEYAAGFMGALMISVFLVAGISVLAFTFSLSLQLQQANVVSGRVFFQIAFLLIGLFGVGVLIAGVFQTDLALAGAPHSAVGDVHNLVVLLMFVAQFLGMSAFTFGLFLNAAATFAWVIFGVSLLLTLLTGLFGVRLFNVFRRYYRLNAKRALTPQEPLYPKGGVYQRCMIFFVLCWLTFFGVCAALDAPLFG